MHSHLPPSINALLHKGFYVVRNKKWKIFLLLNVIELFERNRINHFLPVYDDFFLWKFNFKDWIFHSAVICEPELCKYLNKNVKDEEANI